MLPFRMFATPHLRPPFFGFTGAVPTCPDLIGTGSESATSPPSPCVRRLLRPGRGKLCVKISPPLNSHSHTSPKTSAKLPQKRPFQISALRTLPSSVSSKSCICHSYENCRVCTNNSHSGTRYAPIVYPERSRRATHHSPLCSSSFFSHSCALFCTQQKLNPFIFKRFRTLCAKTPGGGGTCHPGSG